MPTTIYYCCGGLVIPKGGREPLLAGLGRFSIGPVSMVALKGSNRRLFAPICPWTCGCAKMDA